MRTVWIVLISIIVAGGIAGSGVYAYQNNKAKSDKETLRNQITVLKTKKADLEKQVADSTATPTSQNGSTSTPATADETTSWKTYTNTRVNYSFEYPAGGLQLNLDETIKYPSTSVADSKTEDLVQFATSSTTYSIRADVSGHATTVEGWITGSGTGGTIGGGFPSTNLSDYSKIAVGNTTAYTSKTSLSTFVVVGTKYYAITAYAGTAPKTGTDTIYTHLLSSFAFTK